MALHILGRLTARIWGLAPNANPSPRPYVSRGLGRVSTSTSTSTNTNTNTPWKSTANWVRALFDEEDTALVADIIRHARQPQAAAACREAAKAKDKSFLIEYTELLPVAFAAGSYERARACLDEALEVAQRLAHPGCGDLGDMDVACALASKIISAPALAAHPRWVGEQLVFRHWVSIFLRVLGSTEECEHEAPNINPNDGFALLQQQAEMLVAAHKTVFSFRGDWCGHATSRHMFCGEHLPQNMSLRICKGQVLFRSRGEHGMEECTWAEALGRWSFSGSTKQYIRAQVPAALEAAGILERFLAGVGVSVS